MDRASLATLLSVLSLAGFGLVYVKLDRLEDRVASSRSAARRDVRHDPEPLRDDIEPAMPAPVREGAAKAGPKESAAKGSDTTEELTQRVRKLEAQARGKKKAPRIRSTKQLFRLLKLTKTQEDRVTSIVGRGKRRVEEIMKIPGADGTTPHERRQALYRMVRESMRTGEWGDTKGAIGNYRVRSEQIPGRNVTYGEEVARVVAETREELVRSLDTTQQRELGDTAIDPMVEEGALDWKPVIGQAKRDAAAEADSD